MLKELRRKMKDQGIETLCLTDEYNIQYVFGSEIKGHVFVTDNSVKMILSNFYKYEDLEKYDTTFFNSRRGWEKAVENLEFEQIHAEDPGKISEYLEVQETDLISEMRVTKTQEELEKVKEACRITDQAFEHLRSDLIGLTEWEAVSKLHKFYSDEGVAESFLLNKNQSLVQRNCLRPHRKPEDKVIKGEDLVIIDTGVRYQGYCSDVTRTHCESPSEKQLELYSSVKNIREELLGMIEPGLEVSKIAQKMEELTEEEGYSAEENMLYLPGHNVGIEVHENPSIRKSSDQNFKEGMVIALEPGLHVEGIGGVRLEDMIYIGEKDIEILSSSSRGL